MHPLNKAAFCSTYKQGEIDVLAIHHPKFKALIALQGSQLLSFQPFQNGRYQPSLVWLSPEAEFNLNESIRGGVPICWPWFGEPNKNPEHVHTHIHKQNSHGFVRTMEWSIESIKETCHQVCITLSISSNAETYAYWPFDFTLKAVFTLSDELSIDLITHNSSSKPMPLTQALHTYFPCSSAHHIRIHGAHNSQYTDAFGRGRYNLPRLLSKKKPIASITQLGPIVGLIME